jgi:nicotinamidase-related amidase
MKKGDFLKKGLLVIDVQNDYFAGGKMELADPQKALEQILRIEQYFLENDLPVIYIQHIKETSNADFFKRGTHGACLHPALHTNASSIIIEKHYPNSFFETNLQKQLKLLPVNQLVITGMMTHMCVDSTTSACAELGYQPIVLADATATKALTYNDSNAAAQQVQISFLAALENFSQVMTTNEYLVKNSAL